MMHIIDTEAKLLEYLDTNGIQYTRTEHPPVFTCNEAANYRPDLNGTETKNLFLRSETRAGADRQYYLVMTACEKRLDLKALGKALGCGKMQFASPEELMEVLGLTPGAVTVLALVNDPARRVSLLLDADYWPSATYLCHPLVNTATLVLEHSHLARFFALTGHETRVVDMPGRS